MGEMEYGNCSQDMFCVFEPEVLLEKVLELSSSYYINDRTKISSTSTAWNLDWKIHALLNTFVL